MLGRCHINEIDDNQAAHVTQAQLAGNFLGCLQVGLKGRLLDVMALGGPGGVDVDGDQCLGRIDNNGTTGGQLHFPLEGGLDLAFYLVTAEQRDFILVQLDLVLERRHHRADEIQHVFMDAVGIDQNLANVLAEVVSYGADNHVAFLMNQERRLALARGLGNGFPELHQIIQIPLKLFGSTTNAGRTHDDAHGLRYLNIVHGVFELGPLVAFNAAGNATGTGVVGHEDQVAAGEGNKRGQGGALVATLFLVDLDDDFLTFGDHVLDVDLALDLARRFLEVLLGDFLQGQKAVAIGAEIHEGSFEARLNAGNTSFIDVGFFLLAGAGFNVEVKQALAVNQSYAQLFRMSCIDEHSFHGKKEFLSFGFDRKPEGSHQRSGMCVPRALYIKGGPAARRIRPFWGVILSV